MKTINNIDIHYHKAEELTRLVPFTYLAITKITTGELMRLVPCNYFGIREFRVL